MDQNEEFIRTLKIEDVPWNRLTTAYGMATELPEYLKTVQAMSNRGSVKEALGEILDNIEHQSSLWHSTPFALIFLVRIYHDAEKQKESNKTAAWLLEELEDFFVLLIGYHDDLDDFESEEPLPLFSDMLNEEYLWPEDLDEEEQDEWWDKGYADELHTSICYYSYELLKEFDV